MAAAGDPVGGAPQAPQVAIIRAAPDMSLTLPETIVLYTISDHHLELICKGGRDSSLDWCLALFGAAIGLSQNVVSFGGALIDNKMPSGVDTFLGLACVVCLAVSVAKFFEHRKTAQNVNELKTSVKTGRKFILKVSEA